MFTACVVVDWSFIEQVENRIWQDYTIFWYVIFGHIIVFYRFRPLLCIIFFYFSILSRVCCVAVNYVIEASATQRWSAQVIMRLRQQQLFSHNTCSRERGTSHSLTHYDLFCLYYLHCTLPHKSITFRFFSIFLLLFFLTVYISIYKQPYDTRASRTTQQIGKEMRWKRERASERRSPSFRHWEWESKCCPNTHEWHFFFFFSGFFPLLRRNLSLSNFIVNLF